MNEQEITYDNLKSICLKKGYVWDDRMFAINIIGIRNHNAKPNKFDDLIVVAYLENNWKYDASLNIHNYADKTVNVYQATTQPGTPWLLKPMLKKGTAIICEGQYVNAYKIDFHKGKYKALCQRLKEVCVFRDNNKNSEYDYINKESGWFGINIHRAHQTFLVENVNWYSGGCQVIRHISDFNDLMKLAERHKKFYGNKFTYTLINTLDFEL